MVGRQLGWVEGDIRLRRDLDSISNGELLQVLEGRRNSLGLGTDTPEEGEEWLAVAWDLRLGGRAEAMAAITGRPCEKGKEKDGPEWTPEDVPSGLHEG